MAGSSRPTLSVVTPAYNEAALLERSLRSIASELTEIGATYELIVVDDGSSDGSWAVLQSMAQTTPGLRIIRLSRHFGKEAAICAGLSQVRGQAAVLMDSDLQHPPSLIREMYRLWKEDGYNVVEGVKDTGGAVKSLRVGPRLFYKLFSLVSGFRLEESTDFKLMDRNALDAWAALPERSLFFRGMSAWTGFRRKQLVFSVPDRPDGESRWSSIQLFGLAINSLTSFSALPIHLITLMGGAFLLFAIWLGALALYYKLTGVSVSGFTTVIILELIIGSLVLTSIGIIGQYISKIFEEVKGRPRFIIAESAGAGRSDGTYFNDVQETNTSTEVFVPR